MQQGELIGPWVVQRRLGKGGMAAVFLCRHQQHHERLAAVKVMTTWGTDEAELARFRREHEVLTRICHEALVGLAPGRHTFGTDDQQRVTWMAMEYVDGGGLDQRIGSLSSAQATWIAGRLADGVALAHAQGVFHRDIKPENVVIGSTGPKLVDFGLALTERQSRLTQLGVFAGTLAYVPNEVFLRGQACSPETHDIYALGVVLYECLRGERAFPLPASMPDNERLAHMGMLKREGTALDPGEGVDPPLRALVQAATAGDPRARLSSMAELAAALRELPMDPVLAALPEETRHADPLLIRQRRPAERLATPRRRGLLRVDEERRQPEARRPAPSAAQEADETDSGFHVVVPVTPARDLPPGPGRDMASGTPEARSSDGPTAPPARQGGAAPLPVEVSAPVVSVHTTEPQPPERPAVDEPAQTAPKPPRPPPVNFAPVSRPLTQPRPPSSPVRIEQVRREQQQPAPDQTEQVDSPRWRALMWIAPLLAASAAFAALLSLWWLRPFDPPTVVVEPQPQPAALSAPPPEEKPAPPPEENTAPPPEEKREQKHGSSPGGEKKQPPPKPASQLVPVTFDTRCASGAKVKLNGKVLGTTSPTEPLTLRIPITQRGKKDLLQGECSSGTSRLEVEVSLAGPFRFEVGKLGAAIHELH